MFALRVPHRHPVTVLQRVRHFHLTPTVLSGHNKVSRLEEVNAKNPLNADTAVV